MWPPSESSHRLSDKITQTVTQFDSNFLTLHNPSTTLVNDLLPRLRPSVERFVYDSIGNIVHQHYRHHYSETDKSFVNKSTQIRTTSTNLHHTCGIRSEFHFRFDKSIALINTLQTSFNDGAFPNLLLQQLLSILVSLKTEVLTQTFGQKELDSMDDIAPIFLFLIVSSTQLTSPTAIYQFLLDVMPQEQRMETEGRTVALLEGASRLVLMDDKHLLD